MSRYCGHVLLLMVDDLNTLMTRKYHAHINNDVPTVTIQHDSSLSDIHVTRPENKRPVPPRKNSQSPSLMDVRSIPDVSVGSYDDDKNHVLGTDTKKLVLRVCVYY